MAKDEKANALQVRGSINVERYKGARAFGDDVKFELRAMKPVRAGQAASSCLICIVCIICVVCSVRNAEQFGIKDLAPLAAGK